MTGLVVSKRTLRLLDAAVAFWVALWIVLGVVCFFEVRGMRSMSDTMGLAGQSLQEAGDALSAVAALPLVGGGIDEAAVRGQELATRTVNDAQAGHTHITRLSVLALLMGGVIPVCMVLCIYVPLRRSLGRARRQAERPQVRPCA